MRYTVEYKQNGERKKVIVDAKGVSAVYCKMQSSGIPFTDITRVAKGKGKKKNPNQTSMF